MRRKRTLGVQICGLHRTLDIRDTGCGERRPSLPLSGDVALTNVSGAALATRLARLDWDLLAGPAPECTALLQVLCTFLGREHYLALYRATTPSMLDPLSICSADGHPWVLDGREAARVKGRRVILVAGVITSDGPLRGAETLIEEAGGRVVGYAAILASPPIARRKDHLFVKEIPELQ